MLQLNVSQTRMALGIAADMACGLRGNHGTMMGPMSAGNACHTGSVAGLLAQEGITASLDILETKNGFCHALAGPDRFDLETLTAELGNPFYVLSPGIGLKKYPSCYHTHRALDALFQMMTKYQLAYDDVAEVEIGTSERALRVLAYPEPSTPYQAKFSMPFVIGCALLDGKVTLETFTEEKLQDSNVQEARKKVRISLSDLPIWPGLADLGPDTQFVGNPVTIRARDGRSYNSRVDTLRGDPSLPLTDEELFSKYRDCARLALSAEDIQEVSEQVLHLEELSDLRNLMARLTKFGKTGDSNSPFSTN
jgi:2-methylcitrate dehydratase PrpD